MQDEKTIKMPIEDIAAVVINAFMESCIEAAKNNWTPIQVQMLERLFKSETEGCEYKCAGCKYWGRAWDAPQTVPEECMWVPYEYDDDWEEKPCGLDGE